MTDEVQVSAEDAPEVVQTEVEQTEAPEAVESTKGQEQDQPAEVEGEGEKPDPEAEDTEDKESRSKARRERRKAELARAKQEAEEARREADAAQRELDRIKSKQMQPPKQEDYPDYDDFIAAKTAYQAVQMMGRDRVEDMEREAQDRAEKAKAAQARQMAEAQTNWASQTEEARERYADFDSVVSAPDLPISDVMARQITMSDQGADIAYHLGMNKDVAASIAAMRPDEQVGAMRLLERVVSVQTPRPRTQSKAPDPINPVKPKATAAKRPEEMSIEEYDAWRRKGGTFKL